MARAARLGREGELAAGIMGPKEGIRMVSGRMRFPDQVTTTTLTEVKNVGYQGYTRQLRDYAAYARDNGLDFNLYVRPSTRLSAPLEAAIRNREINLRYLP